ncbi:MAG: hypothetical protein ACI9XZ_004486, partial [Alphaproteobacteria bacterium]
MSSTHKISPPHHFKPIVFEQEYRSRAQLIIKVIKSR